MPRHHRSEMLARLAAAGELCVGAPRARFQNVWWTLTMISAARTLVVAVLEALRDPGLVMSIAGMLLTMLFGPRRAARRHVRVVSSVAKLRKCNGCHDNRGVFARRSRCLERASAGA